MPTRPEGASSVLRASKLDVGYGRNTVVSGVELELPPGATLALVGVNGSGKSTLLKTFAGLLPAISGTLAVLGGRAGGAPARVAYLGQSPSNEMILPVRAIDVVRMARFPSLGLLRRPTPRDEERVRESMATLGVLDIAMEPLRALSGGQRQRVYIANALARDAELLLLDEPEANLDAAGREIFRAALRAEVARGRTVVVATHDVQEASRSELAMLLAHRIVAFGAGAAVLTPEALLSTFGVTARIAGGNVVLVEGGHGEGNHE